MCACQTSDGNQLFLAGIGGKLATKSAGTGSNESEMATRGRVSTRSWTGLDESREMKLARPNNSRCTVIVIEPNPALSENAKYQNTLEYICVKNQCDILGFRA